MSVRRPDTATILFTDLVGSTALRTSLGEERADALQADHDRLLAGCIDEHGGRIVKSLGDGAMAAFGSASDAISAAVAIQVAASAYGASPDAVAPLTLRIGVSTGDVSWDEAGDCFGTPVIEAARLEAAADAGQILCSTLTRMITRGRGGHEFVDVGELDLKGLAEPLPACEVPWSFDPAALGPTLPLPGPLDMTGAGLFVGRADELRVLASAATGDDAAMSLVCLLGEPGIGKTRLAAEIASLRHAGGVATVLFGRCEEDLPVPFRPFVEALTFYVRHLPADELADRLGPDAARLGLLCPDIWSLVSGLERPAPASAETEQYRLFEAIRGWLAANRILIVVDDIQWATRPTLQLFRHLLRSEEPSATSIIATARDTEMPDELAKLLDDSALTGRVTRVELLGLGITDVARLVANEQIEVGLDADDVLARSGGNPFFVRALLLDGMHGGTSTAAAAVRRRIQLVPKATSQCLTVGALLGLQFELVYVAAASGRAASAVLDDVESGVRAGLVREVGPNLFRFAHALVRDALLAQLSDTRRLQLHEQVGLALVDRDGVPPSEIAYHFSQAIVDSSSARRASEWHVRAAARADSLAAFSDAAEHFRQASELLPISDVEQRLTLEVESHRVAVFGGDFGSEVVERLSELSAEGRAAGLTDVEVRALNVAFHMDVSVGRDVRRLLDLYAAVDIEAVSDHLLQAEVLVVVPILWAYSGREPPPDADAQIERGIEMARELGAPTIEALGLQAQMHLLTVREPTNIAPRVELVGRAIDLCRASGDTRMVAHHAWIQVGWFNFLGDRDGADSLRDTMRDYADAGDNPWARFMYLSTEAVRAFTLGDLSESECLSSAADAAGDSVSGFDAGGAHGVQMFAIRREQGRLDEFRPMIEMALRRQGSSEGIWRPGAAALFADLGIVEPAATQLAALVTEDGPLVPADSRLSMSLSFLTDACVLVGDIRRAAVIHTALEPYSGLTVTMPGNACLGPVDRYLARLAGVMGDTDEALDRLDAAFDLADRMRSPLFAAQAMVDRASVLAHLGDVDGARGAATGALDTIGSLDLPRVRARAEALRAAGST